MPVIEVEGVGRVSVGEAFLRLSPEERQETVDEIAASAAPAKAGVRQGSLWPVDIHPDGTRTFNSDAGLLGAAKRALSLPGDVSSGAVPLHEATPSGEVRTSGALIDRAAEAGGLVSPMNPAVRSGGRVIPGEAQNLQRAPTAVPTADELLAAGGKGFDDVRALGVDYKVPAVVNQASTVRAELEKKGLFPDLAPLTFKTLSQLERPGAATHAPLSGLMAARTRLGQIATNAAGRPDGQQEAMAAGEAIRALDEFIAKADPRSVMAGPAPAAGGLLKEANSNYSAGKRSQDLNRKLDSAELQAASTNSGQNTENLLRGKARRIVDPEHPERARGYSKGEIQLIRDVAEGKITGTNTLRFVGNLLGGGGGLGMLATAAVPAATASQVLGPAGVLASAVAGPAIGFGLKSGSTALTRKAFNKADEAIRKRSALYERMEREAPMEAPSALKKAALNKALLIAHMRAQEEKRKRR